MYGLLIYLLPGVKWQVGNYWQIASRGMISVVNDYRAVQEGAFEHGGTFQRSSISLELYFRKQFL